MEGAHKFLRRAWNWVLESKDVTSVSDPLVERAHHQLIQKVTERLEAFKFNVVVSAFMEFMNEVSALQNKKIDSKTLEDFLILLSPLAPHFSEELWLELGHRDSIFKEKWPIADPKWLASQVMSIVIQVNGKLRANIEVPKDLSKDEIIKQACSHPNVQKYLEGKKMVKEIYVPGKLVNLVVQG